MVPELTVGMVKDWFPYEFIDDEGNPQGISIDIFKIATELTGQHYKFVVFDRWGDLMTSFRSGKIDMVANITASESRSKFADFTSSYWQTPWSITTHKSQENVDSIEKFYGKRIALIEGYQMIKELSERYPQVIIQVVESFDEALTLLKAGVIDGVLDNMLVSAGYLQENNLYQFKIHVIEDLPYDISNIGVRQDLKQQLRMMEKIVSSITDKDREKIITRWSKIDVVQGINSKIYLRNVIAFIFIATVVIASVLFWNRRLQNEIKLRITAETKLKHLASHDLMTGLPNRALFNDRLNQAIVSHRRNNKVLAVMFVDLDGFKQVNDTFGHDVGDELLIMVSDRLRVVGRASDTVARIGGDEFVILVTDLDDTAQASKVAEKLLRTLSVHLICPLQLLMLVLLSVSLVFLSMAKPLMNCLKVPMTLCMSLKILVKTAIILPHAKTHILFC
ncbi:transporter substrate-binding domain-containing diguanylate cyclase [Psychrosphaera algicola]|uniref:Diguanylate cyclase n=1 Tax=Psychrosphaera algicola TaxID=3023714 RepID=A0ABT5FIA1_9GAMM|nr:diguanylate cyclase [Psychrosphaera sp. G1-22]MDC2890925.1 diguanylate cyclase [Psychrosphaera sp. G1-22]